MSPRKSRVSKAARVTTPDAPPMPMVRRAGSLRLAPGASVETGLHRIVSDCLAQMLDNEAGVIHGDDLESVHQMRVGVRRLRFAMRVFAHAAPPPEALQAELQWLARKLGAARDWEVLAGSTLFVVEEASPEEVGLAALRNAAQSLAAETRKLAAAAVGSLRYSRLLLALGHWLESARARETLPPAQQAALAGRLAKLSGRILTHWQGKLDRVGKSLNGATPESRHRVRIVARQLRYAAEFFVSLYPPRRMQPYVKNLIALQDGLGRLNDAAVAIRLLRGIAQTDNTLAASAGFVTGYLIFGTQADICKLDKSWKKFERVEPPHGK